MYFTFINNFIHSCKQTSASLLSYSFQDSYISVFPVYVCNIVDHWILQIFTYTLYVYSCLLYTSDQFWQCTYVFKIELWQNYNSHT